MNFRALHSQLLRRTDEVRWAPSWLARNPGLATRCDPAWAPITQSGWIGFQNTRAKDWEQYEFRRPSAQKAAPKSPNNRQPAQLTYAKLAETPNFGLGFDLARLKLEIVEESLEDILTADRWTHDVTTGKLVQDRDGPWVMIKHRQTKEALRQLRAVLFKMRTPKLSAKKSDPASK